VSDKSPEVLLARLISSANALCELPLDAPDSPERFESYTSQVDEFMSVTGAGLRDMLASPLGQEFMKVHSQVIQQAGAASRQVGEEIRRLKRRGKGILAYTDVLPQRLGTIRPRKG
jgi:hypothetical protein